MTYSIVLMILVSGYTYYAARTPRIIGTNYMTRYFIIPRNRWLNIYLHKYTGSDDDRALHDHRWNSVSFLLKGSLYEVVPSKIGVLDAEASLWPKKFLPKYRNAIYKHRIVLASPTAWTLFITGRKVRDWGFHCPKGWVHWHNFTDETGNHVGRGCE